MYFLKSPYLREMYAVIFKDKVIDIYIIKIICSEVRERYGMGIDESI